MIRRAVERRGPIDGWPEVIELVILAIRAGASPSAAIAVVGAAADGEIADAFADVTHRMHRGMRLGDAIAALPERLGPQAAELADTIATADRYGLALEPILDRLSSDARSERRRRAEVEARSLPVRLAFPLVVCTLPSFVLLAIVPAVLGALATLRSAVP
jgi:tight adherence protein C